MTISCRYNAASLKNVVFLFFFFLQTKMKQLEQEAHQAAGEIFLITSNTQLRAVCIFVYGCFWAFSKFLIN